MRKSSNRKRTARRSPGVAKAVPAPITMPMPANDTAPAARVVPRTRADEVRDELDGWKGAEASGFRSRVLLWGGRRLMGAAVGLMEFAERRRRRKEAKSITGDRDG